MYVQATITTVCSDCGATRGAQHMCSRLAASAYELSLATAEHHRETWELYEDELLFDADVATVALVLGRTTYAVSQRRYALRHGAVPGDRSRTSNAPQVYRGWTCAMGDE